MQWTDKGHQIRIKNPYANIPLFFFITVSKHLLFKPDPLALLSPSGEVYCPDHSHYELIPFNSTFLSNLERFPMSHNSPGKACFLRLEPNCTALLSVALREYAQEQANLSNTIKYGNESRSLLRNKLPKKSIEATNYSPQMAFVNIHYASNKIDQHPVEYHLYSPITMKSREIAFHISELTNTLIDFNHVNITKQLALVNRSNASIEYEIVYVDLSELEEQNATMNSIVTNTTFNNFNVKSKWCDLVQFSSISGTIPAQLSSVNNDFSSIQPTVYFIDVHCITSHPFELCFQINYITIQQSNIFKVSLTTDSIYQ